MFVSILHLYGLCWLLAVQLYVEFEMSSVVCNDGVMIIKRVLHKFRSIFCLFWFSVTKTVQSLFGHEWVSIVISYQKIELNKKWPIIRSTIVTNCRHKCGDAVSSPAYSNMMKWGSSGTNNHHVYWIVQSRWPMIIFVSFLVYFWVQNSAIA